MKTREKRLRILGQDEIEALYGRPRFSHEERVHYFALTEAERAQQQALRTVSAQTYFILQLGYFKAKRLFFPFSFQEVAADTEYILEEYFDAMPSNDLRAINKRTLRKQRQFILERYHYRFCNGADRQALEKKARQAAVVSSKPVYLFRELMQYLTEQRIVLPGYSFLQTTIGQALTFEQNRLMTIVQEQLTARDIQELKQLLEDSQGLYELTLLKREPRDFRFSEIKREIEQATYLRPLYDLAQRVLPALHISNESIIYYASLVSYYSVFRLKRFAESLVDLYLLCFVFHRYQRLHDILLNSLLHHVNAYSDAAKAGAKEQIYAYHSELNQDLQKVGELLRLFTDETVAKDTRFVEVQTLAFQILDRAKIDRIVAHLHTHTRFDETALQWEQLEQLARQFKRHLRPLLLTVTFSAVHADAPLLHAVAFLQEAYQKGKPLNHYPTAAFPSAFIPENSKRYLYQSLADGQQRILPDRYEFLVYRLLRNGLEAGDIFCRESVRFRSFEDDLVPERQWQKKEELIATSGLTSLQQPIQEHMATLEQLLEARIIAVNQRLLAGENPHFQRTSSGKRSRWTLHYPAGSEPVNHAVFDTLHQVNIGDVLQFVHQQCHFLDAFDHLLGRYTRQEPDTRLLTACLVAWATNLGLGKMSETSDVSYQALVGVSEALIRLETLASANDAISNALAALPIFHYYDIADTLHSSSDGQRFATQLHTINARHSPKYFGLQKGIVSYTLVANHVPLHAQVISANDHESHYVFDLLYNNTTTVQPTIHSTDTHGTNEVNFALLHLFGYQFAPRYKDIHDKVTSSLYGIQHPSQYGDMPLKPIRKLNTELIIDEWDNIQRILVSLALKETTQSIMISKLSAHARKNRTKRALWEYDNLIRSLYLLDYIDSPPLRRSVQQALNRGESYHKLRRAVSYANFGKLHFKTEHEQQIWNECSRLLTNCIIFYNATILSALLAYKQRNGQDQDLALLKHISPVAWQHINLHGRYEFNKTPDMIDLDALVQTLDSIPLFP